MALLLPGILSKSRKVNQTNDIRRNLHLSYPDDHPENNPEKEYCVEFEVVKASKGCRKEEYFSALKEGERVCVRCESQALRKNLGYRCQGHGVGAQITRWTAMTAPHCHGKWLRPYHSSSTTTHHHHSQQQQGEFDGRRQCITTTTTSADNSTNNSTGLGASGTGIFTTAHAPFVCDEAHTFIFV